MSPDRPPRRDSPWIVPGGEAQGLVSYLEAIKAGRWIIVGALIACVGASLLYLAQATKVYETAADVLVNPQGDSPVQVSGIITQSSDPTRDVETVARLIESPPVARRVITELESRRLGLGRARQRRGRAPRPEQHRHDHRLRRDAGSSEAPRGRLRRAVRRLPHGAVCTRRSTPRSSSWSRSCRKTAREVSIPGSPAAQLSYLRSLSAGDDPSVRFVAPAELPGSAASPRPF